VIELSTEFAFDRPEDYPGIEELDEMGITYDKARRESLY